MEQGTDLVRAIAQDLTALHDPDLILTGLVRRVRDALGCDLAYISLNEADTRETRIRFADGVRTSEYGSIRMPIGTGVLGLAAAGVTTESPDYLPDAARLHIEAVDIAVNVEGVRAILGTPLRAGGEVIGALTIANRTSGGFTADQRARLEDAALIASSAVEVYRLRQELERLTAAHHKQLAILREDTAATSEQLSLFQMLASALAEGHGSSELLQIASAAVGGTVHVGEGTFPDSEGVATFPLTSEGKVEVVGADPHITATLAPTIATVVSVALLYEHAIEDARHFREVELVERLIDPPASVPGPAPRTGLAGTGQLDVIAAEISDSVALRSALAQVRHLLGPRAISATRRGNAVVIARRDSGTKKTLLEALAPFPHYAGIATAHDESRLPAAYAEAALLARAARRLGRANQLTSWAQLGVVAFALGGSPGDAQGFVTSQLAAIDGDSDRDAALRETALHFLDTQGSVPEVARRLTIHENTVRQRIGRLDALIPGWRQGDRALDVHVALRAHLLIGR